MLKVESLTEVIAFQDFRAPYQELRADLDAAYRRFMESAWYVLGEEVHRFEEEYAAFCESRQGVGLGSGLEALHLGLRALGAGPGNEVIVPANTYIATWLAVSQTGAVPVAVDPDERTMNLDPARADEAVSPRTKAILAVNLYGLPCDYEGLAAVARNHGIWFLTDNAQGHGARFQGRRVGGLADLECHSFYPSKNLGAYGEAGAVTTNDPELADRVGVLRNYGSRVRNHNEVVGYNARLDELQAAFLRVKLRRLDDWNERRSRIAEFYLRELPDCPELVLPTVPEWATPAWHLFVIRHPRRDALQQHLKERGVQTLVHYPVPPHLSGAYGRPGKDSATAFQPAPCILPAAGLPVAEKLAREVLSLPIGPHLSLDQAGEVVEAVRGFCR